MGRPRSTRTSDSRPASSRRGRRRCATSATATTSPAGLTYGYRLRGRYAEELRRWFAHYDRERVLVLASERLFADPEGTTREACEWLGVEPPAVLDVTPYNVGSYDDEVPDDLRTELTDYYRPLNEELFDLLGQRFDWTT